MITAPGIYDIDIELYHSQKCCDGPSISSSGLRVIDRECPARFWAYSDLNPKRFEKETKAVFAFGRAAHALMLGEPAFEKRFMVAPHEQFNSNPGKAWHTEWKLRVELGDETRDLVRPSQLVVVKDMVAAQRSSPECARAFIEGEPEKSILWKDNETGVWVKSRPDWLPHKPAERFITEYKTAETIQPRKLSFNVFMYGYEMQAAMVLDGIEIVTGVEPLGFAHVVQEKDPPYIAELKMFTPEQLDYGRLEYRRALRKFADCLATGKWPGWTHGPSYYDTPYSITKAMENFDDGQRGEGTGEFDHSDYAAAG